MSTTGNTDNNNDDSVINLTEQTTSNLVTEAPTHYVSYLKIPPFWNNRPDLWFLQVESQFRVKNISASSTKYDYLVASLPAETMELVGDILQAPPTSDKYEKLKHQLLERSRDSEEQRLNILLHKVELGDSKPSELYRQMESLAGDNSLVNKSLLKKLWLNKLPSTVQTCLIAVESKHTQEELFNIADKIVISTTSSSPQISAVQRHSSPHKNSPSFSDTIRKLENRIKKLEIGNSRARSRSQSRSRSLNRKYTSPHRTQDLCWYHKRHGNNANKCTPPCARQSFSEAVPKNDD